MEPRIISSLGDGIIRFFDLLIKRKGERSMGIIQHVKEEFQVIKERDPAIKSPMEVLLYPSFRVMQIGRAHV